MTRTDPRVLRSVPATGLRLTWFGHSSTLVQIDGVNVLTDPFWSDRATPVAGLGPKRWYAPPIALAKLPRIDAVVVSHDHYDHLDSDTIRALSRRGHTRFIVPLGVGAHLEAWGVPVARIVELDWWQSTLVGGVRIHATPARHYSGRLVPRGNTALWAGYAFVGPRNRVYYTGDTSYMPEMAEIRRLGPFDLVLTDSGQYNPGWPDVHLGPEQAVELAAAVGAKTMVPIHWGLIRLAHHSWPEPAERTLVAASCMGVRVVIPPPGLPVEPAADLQIEKWWPRVRWQTASEAPIRSSQNGQGQSRFQPAPCRARP